MRFLDTNIIIRYLPIINMRGLKLPRKGLYRRALDLYAMYPGIDFEDVLSVAYMEADGIAELYSYETDFDAIEGVRRVEPSPLNALKSPANRGSQ